MTRPRGGTTRRWSTWMIANYCNYCLIFCPVGIYVLLQGPNSCACKDSRTLHKPPAVLQRLNYPASCFLGVISVRSAIVDMCFELVEAAGEAVRVCVASRPEKELAFCLQANQPSEANNLILEEHTARDIHICVRQEISRISRLLTKDVQAHLISTISQQARGFFMWTKLASRDIGRSCMEYHIVDHEQHIRLLNHLPKEYGD